jgi:hypothetical protein
VLGTAAHQALDLDLSNKIVHGEDLPKEQVVEDFAASFRVESEDAVENPAKNETKGTMLDSGVAAVGHWYDKVAPVTHPAAVEEHVQYKLNGIVIDGTIDIVHQDGRIGDWKFVGRTPDSGGAYLLNMVGYAIGYRRKTGRVETGIVLDHIVRLKKPKHVPIASGPVPDESILTYGGIIEDVSRSIEAGLFPPTGLKSNACTWCGYRDICTAYRAVS